MNPSVVIINTAPAMPIRQATPRRWNREQVHMALTLLNLSAWAYTMVAGASALS